MSQATMISASGKPLVPDTPQNTPAQSNLQTSLSRPQIPDSVQEDDEDESDLPVISSSNNAQSGLGGLSREDLVRNPAFAAMVEGKLAGLMGRSSGYVEALPLAIRHRVDGLQGLQVEQAKIENEFQAELLELEKKYLKKYTPLYQQRASIIAGSEEPADDLVEKGKKVDEDEEDSEDEEDEAEPKAQRPKPTQAEIDAAPKGIPEFWLTALKNHMGLSELITERDSEALKFLSDIRVEYLDGRSGFKLLFDFAEGAQEFFDNKTLEKTYVYQDEVGYEGDFIYDHAEGTDINWKEGKDLTHKTETKKQRNKNTNQTRIIKKQVPTDSFFNFFKPPVLPEDDDEDADEDLEAGIESKLELDYQIGEDIKERVIPRAVDYFTGKALKYDKDMDIESDDEFDEYDDDDDEGGLGRPPPAAMGVTPSSSQDPAECKQS